MVAASTIVRVSERRQIPVMTSCSRPDSNAEHPRGIRGVARLFEELVFNDYGCVGGQNDLARIHGNREGFLLRQTSHVLDGRFAG